MYRQKNSQPFLPYSHQRIKQILEEDYHCGLHSMNWYKCNRVFGYVNKYRLVNNDTGETLVEWITLNAIRIFLTQQGYPLKPEKYLQPNKGSVEFLKFVESKSKKLNH